MERQGDVEAASRTALLDQIMKRGWTVLSVEVTEPSAVPPPAPAPVAPLPSIAPSPGVEKPLKPFKARAFKIVGGLQIFFGGAAALFSCSEEVSRHSRLVAEQGVQMASRVPMDFTEFYMALACFTAGILVFSFGEWMARIDAMLREIQPSHR